MTTAPSDRRALAVLMLAGLAGGVAVWLLPASNHIVSWRDGAAGRVALVAPLSWLGWAVLGGVCLTAAAGWWWHRSGRRLDTLARLLAPLLLLWLWVVPYLPWLPAHVPLVLLLAGPMRWIVAGLALAGCIAAAVDTGQLRLGTLRWPGRRFVVAASLVVFVGVGHYVKRVQELGGDEPHYLVITHSLLADGDLDIENNHQNRNYQAFDARELPMHFLERGRGGVVYSIHSPGLPALMLPGYAVAGHWGALATVGVVAALAALAVFDLAATIASPPIALATWAAIAFTIPFGLHSWLLFPEMPAALLMAWVALWVWRDGPDRPWPWVWRGVALSLLPWLHMKFSLLLLVSGLWLAYRLWPRVRLVVALLAPIGVSGLLWLASFYVMYGDVNPAAAYGYAAGADLSWLNIPRGLLGLSFDQEYGLLPYSPIFAVAALGGWALARRPDTRGYVVGVLLVIAPFLATTTQYYMWWGGNSVPARFVVPILPLLAPLIAVAMRDFRSSAARGGVALALAYSMLTFVVVVIRPAARLMYNDRDATGRLVEAAQAGAPLSAALPSFIDPDILIQLPSTLVWVAAAIVAAVTTRLVVSRAWAGGFWSATVTLLVFAGSGSLFAAMVLPDTSGHTVEAGRQRLLQVYPGEHAEAFSYDAGGWLEPAALVERGAFERRFDDGPATNPAEMAGPFSLPPGRYDLQVWFDEPQTGDGQVFLSYDLTGGLVARAYGRGGSPEQVPLELPVGLTALRVAATSPELAAAVTGVRVVPRVVVGRDDRREVGRIWAVKPIGARPGAYLFFMNLYAFVDPDTNWVRGERTAELLVSPADAARMRVVIRNGGAGNRIAVTVGDHTEQLELAAWETGELALPVSPGGELIPISVASEGGFVPAEVEPGSTDTRLLGCTVTVVLE